jgi:hypothetical protein
MKFVLNIDGNYSIWCSGVDYLFIKISAKPVVIERRMAYEEMRKFIEEALKR